MNVSAPKPATQILPIIQNEIPTPEIQNTNSKIKQIFNDSMEKLTSMMNTTVDTITSVVHTTVGSITSVVNTSVETITSIVNTTVETITSGTARIKNRVIAFLPEIRFELTETKIQQVIITVFSGYSFLAARTVAGGGLPTTMLQWSAASPFLAVSTAAIWYALSLVDYENPEKLEKIRKQAQKLPLNEVIDLHGWKNLFKYEILNPQEFRKVFHQFASALTFKDLYTAYTEAKKELSAVNSSSSGCQHQLPKLAEWAPKFKQETALLTHDVILQDYPLSDLRELLTKEEIIPFEQMQVLLDEQGQEREVFEKTLNDYLDNAREKSLKALLEAQSTLSEIDIARGPDGSQEKLPFLGEDFEKVRSEANDKHQSRLGEIHAKMDLHTLAYSQPKSRANKA